MTLPTSCQIPGTVFATTISGAEVSVAATLPMPLDLTESQAELLEANLHNVIELVLARFFPGRGSQ